MRTSLIQLICLWLAILGACSHIAPSAAGAEETDPYAIEGKWFVASFNLAGRPIDGVLNDTVVFADGHSVYRGKEDVERARFWIDPRPTPKHFDILLPDEEGRPALCRGIYKVEGDTLTVCHGDHGDPRPTAFTSNERNGHVLVVLQRSTLAQQE